MSDEFDEVVHVAPATISEELVELGAENVIAFPDLLTHGPVSVDPKRHRKARLKYWRGIFGAVVADGDDASVAAAMARIEDGYLSTEQLGSAAAHSADGERIVIWTTPSFEDRLFLWFAFEALTAKGVPESQIATAEPRIELPAVADEPARFASLRSLDVAEIARGFDDLFYPQLVYVEAGANLWETFSSNSPRQVAISIPHTTKFFPEFDVFAEDYGRLFPMVRGESPSRVELSELDADLLGRLDEAEERRAAEIFDATLLERYAYLDEVVLLARLQAWAGHDADERYVEGTSDAGVDDLFEQHAYRLTERGRELLEEGFEPGRKLPLFFVGDSRLYAGKKPWVRVIINENWWFERYSPPE